MGKRSSVSSRNYSTSAISERTGLTRNEINQLRSEARQTGGTGAISRATGKVGIQRKTPLGTGRVSANGTGRFSVGGTGVTYNPKTGAYGGSAFGFGVTKTQTGGSVSLPGGISIRTYEKGCYIVQIHSIFGQEAFSNINKKPECDDDDDDDNGGGSDEPKPPHCVGADGQPGTGEPKNLLPTCLDDGQVHVFNISGMFMFEEDTGGNNQYRQKRWLSSPKIVYKNGLLISADATYNISDTTPEYANSPVFNGTQPSGLPGLGQIVGTYQQMLNELKRLNVPRTVESKTWSGGNFKEKSWAIVHSPDGNCNPTGNEGCDNDKQPTPSNGTSDKNKPYPTGLPNRVERDNIKRRDLDDEKDMDRCCANVKKIAKALAVDEVLGEGLTIPGRLVTYKAKKKITMKSYLEIFENHFRVADNLGIHPIEIEIKDSNKSKEGDQHYEATFINATASIKQLLELGLESKGDSADRLGILFRIAWINVQILNSIVAVTRGVQGLMQFFGMPIRERAEKVWIPFDVTLGAREKIKKGFGGNKSVAKKPSDDQIKKTMELRDEDTLESVLPKFLNSVEQPVLTENFDDTSGMTFFDVIRQLLRK